jgi:MOSC domain-containing protein YiiM
VPVLLSVNRGAPEKIAAKAGLTGIFKRPVEEAWIGELGLAGDAVLDRKHHGGPDQAVYLYLGRDYDWWSAELSEPLVPGTFGENLTVGGLDGDTLAVGDRFAIGEVVLEVTSHRTPCTTLAARLGSRAWIRRFHLARRPGAYLRVLAAGAVRPGMAVGYSRYSGPRVTLAELVDLDGQRAPDPAFLRRALEAPVHYKMRADFEARLAALADPKRTLP